MLMYSCFLTLWQSFGFLILRIDLIQQHHLKWRHMNPCTHTLCYCNWMCWEKSATCCWRTCQKLPTKSDMWPCIKTPFGFNPLNAELNPICHLLALLGAHHILHVSRIRVNTTMESYHLHTKATKQFLHIDGKTPPPEVNILVLSQLLHDFLHFISTSSYQ